eukprot:12709-Heterococcus_DN1.PRE.10
MQYSNTAQCAKDTSFMQQDKHCTKQCMPSDISNSKALHSPLAVTPCATPSTATTYDHNRLTRCAVTNNICLRVLLRALPVEAVYC